MSEVSLGGYQNKDDTLHPKDNVNDDYYEWWYSDARFDNGYACVATFHWLNAFIRPHIPTVQLFVYTPEGKKYIGMAAVDQKDCTSNPNICDVKMGKNFIRQEGEKYVVSLHAQKIGVDLTYHRRVPGWKQNGTGYLFDDGGKKQGWVIAAPRSDVEGTIYIEGVAVPVKGRGYHDKNWGNSNMYDCFSGWYWGRLYDPTFTLIYYWLFPVDKKAPLITRLLLAQESKPILVTNDYKLRVEKEEPCEKFGKKLPMKILVQNSDKSDVKFRCELVTTEVKERDKLPKIAQWDQYHWRFLGDHKISVTVGGKTLESSGKAIHEHLLFRE
jgi:predicted secreted hydrolase